MNCRDHESTLLDIARGVPVDADAAASLDAHVEECHGCRARQVREQALTSGLRSLARATAAAVPSDALEAPLLDAFRALHPAGSAGVGRPRWWVAAAAAMLVAAAGLVLLLTTERIGGRDDRLPEVTVATTEFVPWPGAASLPAFESGELVRTELPASVLPLLGLVPASTVTDNKVLADVLIGQDGLARAVRLASF